MTPPTNDPAAPPPDTGTDPSGVDGNAPEDTKQVLLYTLQSATTGFARGVGRRVRLREAGTRVRDGALGRVESRVVCAVVVDEEMVHAGGFLHGGCAAFLIDLCSTLAVMVHTQTVAGDLAPGVSLALNIVYHAPAAIGDSLRIVNTTLSVGARAMSACTEIWSETRDRLVASGTHVKMDPSAAKASARL